MPTKPLSELEAMVGDSRTTVEAFRIERGKVEEFARAITESDPLFRDASVARDRGYEAVPAPLTYAQVSRFPRYRPDGLEGQGKGFDLGFRPEYVLHGEQAYEYERPLLVGDVLTGTTTLSDVYQRDGGRAGSMTFAVYETEYRDESGGLVLTDRVTAIETSGAVGGEGDDASGDDDTGNDEPQPDSSGSNNAGNADTDATVDPEPAANGGAVPAAEPVDTVRSLDGVDVGDGGPTVVVEDLERKHFVKYAGASGDFNPIHYDEPYARGAGNESVFGQGMFTAGVASRAVTDWFALESITAFGVRFQSQVFPGDTIVATGELESARAEEGVVEVALEATNQHGETLLTGSATASLEE
ncbi:MaoC family dehydratase N-terminal domain-containing protein [Haloterrigena sp. SYSU A121-1]|uniref:MaoC family dehydratase N-terminal domain-containing protein n=1 Tax=Haloterrigena gelatinilytica TaxID=2741724 RepID=A0A8J8GSA4_9EURY|nr:MaoC family dehydratase N-terminal domain-containing protein [Haloterrigena gelatinilytica]NUB92600.1 MaoC family dehydratase N-terminal domain-containing protein [Haloterrigena gelatinilytica]